MKCRIKNKTRREFIKSSVAAGSLAFLSWGITSCKSGTFKGSGKTYSPESLKGMGLLDITQAPYLADPKGVSDSTAAIQKAVNDARDKGMVCFFPEGTYLVSDMISAEQKITPRDTPYTNLVGTRHFDAILKPMILMGSTRGKRPLIKLSKEAKGFDDPANPKKVIWIWAQGWFDAPGKVEPAWGEEQGNINFNHFFMNIDIDVSGHAGAIGIRHSGSQGSAMMNSTINAEGAYCGMSNCCGQGGGTYNMEVIGGEYGIIIDSDSRFPILTSCTFRGQKKASVAYAGPRIQVPSVFTGCRFAPDAKQAIDIENIESHGGLLMIDSMFEVNESGSIVKTSKKENIFIENSYASGASSVYSQGTEMETPGNWKYIKNFSLNTDQGTKMINGEVISDAIIQIEDVSEAPAYKSLHDIHFTGLPSFEDADALNVKDFGAVGDGANDDTEAFRAAIAKGDKIFVPNGHYTLTGTLELREKTQIFGLSKNFASIGNARTDAGGLGLERYENASEFTLSTVDNKDSAPGLYFISTGGRIDWRSGKGTWFLSSGRPAFNGNGGGKFYGFGAMSKPFILEGITQPTSFYALNVERVQQNPQSEIRNCSNIRIYYFKVEAGSLNSSIEDDLRDANTPCRIIDSTNITIYCMTGVVLKLREHQAMLSLVESNDIKLVHIKSFQAGLFPQVREMKGGMTFEVAPEKIASLYLRE
jgi:hypothetical protein